FHVTGVQTCALPILGPAGVGVPDQVGLHAVAVDAQVRGALLGLGRDLAGLLRGHQLHVLDGEGLVAGPLQVHRRPVQEHLLHRRAGAAGLVQQRRILLADHVGFPDVDDLGGLGAPQENLGVLLGVGAVGPGQLPRLLADPHFDDALGLGPVLDGKPLVGDFHDLAPDLHRVAAAAGLPLHAHGLVVADPYRRQPLRRVAHEPHVLVVAGGAGLAGHRAGPALGLELGAAAGAVDAQAVGIDHVL